MPDACAGWRPCARRTRDRCGGGRASLGTPKDPPAAGLRVRYARVDATVHNSIQTTLRLRRSFSFFFQFRRGWRGRAGGTAHGVWFRRTAFRKKQIDRKRRACVVERTRRRALVRSCPSSLPPSLSLSLALSVSLLCPSHVCGQRQGRHGVLERVRSCARTDGLAPLSARAPLTTATFPLPSARARTRPVRPPAAGSRSPTF